MIKQRTLTKRSSPELLKWTKYNCNDFHKKSKLGCYGYSKRYKKETEVREIKKYWRCYSIALESRGQNKDFDDL